MTLAMHRITVEALDDQNGTVYGKVCAAQDLSAARNTTDRHTMHGRLCARS